MSEKMGRKPMLNDDVIKGLANGINTGLTRRSACALQYISETSFYRWMSEGEKDVENGEDTIYAKLYDEVKKAEANFKGRRIQNIKKQGEGGHWQADAWLLERLYPEEFGRKNAVELTGNTENPVEIEHKGNVEIYAVRLPDNGRD